jgi:biotin synthase
MNIKDIFKKAENLEPLSKDEIIDLIGLENQSQECYEMMYIANRMSREMFSGKGENHLHIGLNAGPCPYDCDFCSLTRQSGLFNEEVIFSDEQLIIWAKEAEDQGADGINVMTTGTYRFQDLLRVGKMLSEESSVPLIANTRDLNHSDGEMLLEAGFVGMYHAVRLGEGIVTPFRVEKRINTLRVLHDVGLKWMNCIEPVGPEHTPEEIAGLMLLAREHGAIYSGVMRRINFPGSPMEKYGMITEYDMARLSAVSRLVMGDVPRAHCTHEPNTLALVAGANLFFPEVGSSPRDTEADSAEGRGSGIDVCKEMFRETGWDYTLKSNVC